MVERELIRVNLSRVLENIERAAERSGRNPEDITLVAVSKNFPAELIREGYELGIKNFGENKAQELREKHQLLSDLPVVWHFIGRIQTNKVKYFVKVADFVHSVCRIKELQEIEKRAGAIKRKIKVFIEVNVSGEETKAGVTKEGLYEILEFSKGLEYVEIIGLMTMAPYVENPEEIRWVFRTLRELRDEVSKFYPNLRELSMGMSNDYQVAIEEGATFVRIGTAIFGKRN